jgi:hypothetical protein
MSIKTERDRRTNRREIDRLTLKLSNGDGGRNVGATEAALDRRLDADMEFYRVAASGGSIRGTVIA